MTRSTVDGRPVFLTRTSSGWAVKWGRTIIARRPTWQQALDEILKLYKA